MHEWIPTTKNLSMYLKEWEKPEYAVQDNILEKLFQKDFPKHNNAKCVFIKVTTLNLYYSTNVIATQKMANHIVKLDGIQSLDSLISSGSYDAVNLIARLPLNKNKEMYFYSFASKYCSFHNPDLYPMYDSIVLKLLVKFLQYKNIQISEQSIYKKYPAYCDAFFTFKKLYSLDMPTRDIDKALWLHGKSKYESKKL